MVGLGSYFILLMAVFFWLSARHQARCRPVAAEAGGVSIPLPWIAAECGWFVAEFGRQPWAIEGVLPVAVAVSNLSAGTVLGSLLGFVALYSVLLVVEMKLMLKAIRKGPVLDAQDAAN